MAMSAEFLTDKQSVREFFQTRVAWLTLLQWTLLFTTFGLLLRIPVVIGYSMFIDDGATLLAASLPMDKLIANRFAMGHIPLFFILFKLWEGIAGDSVVALRIPSLLMSLATVPLAGLMCVPLRSPRGALIAMAVAVFHGTLLRHAAELRMYSWMMVCGPLLVYTLLSVLEKPRAWKFIVAGLLHFLFLTLHVSAFLFSLSVFVAMACVGSVRAARPRLPTWLGFAGAFAIPVGIVLPMMLMLREKLNLQEYQKFTMMNPHRQLLSCFYELVNGIGMGGNTWKQVVIGVLLPAFAAALLAFRPTRHAEEKSPALFSPTRVAAIYLVAGFGSPVLAYLISILYKPAIGFARYYVTGTPMLIAVFGAAAATIHWRSSMRRRALAAAFLVALGVTAEMTFYRVRRIVLHEDTGLNALVMKLKKDAPDGCVVIIADQGATRRIVEVYLKEDLRRYTILPINSDWTEQGALAELERKASRDAELFMFFFRDEDPRVVNAVRKFYGTGVKVDVTEQGNSQLFRFSPRVKETAFGTGRKN
ncbi:hypothetical protein IT570_13540 [Candidatus Sumerlaeota bacterium]|nr:hypothetical protein [Candidatus Sumerlaeota bacterium]